MGLRGFCSSASQKALKRNYSAVSSLIDIIGFPFCNEVKVAVYMFLRRPSLLRQQHQGMQRERARRGELTSMCRQVTQSLSYQSKSLSAITVSSICQIRFFKESSAVLGSVGQAQSLP